ncbi:Aminopeptidase S [termite gut metagenome]|uniref:Aminopeptidase S n=1 Tax=termite gut metagenome TaxID=433724 RepID=A0A5J4PR07_9ZZZZ
MNAAMIAWFALNAAQDNARIPVKPGVLEKLKDTPQMRF